MIINNQSITSRAEVQRYESLVLSMKQILLFATPSLDPDTFVSMTDTFIKLAEIYKPEGYEIKNDLENILKG